MKDDALRRIVAYLASDGLEGRLPGTPGEAAAAAFIEAEFRAIGLKPLARKGFQQPFSYARKDGVAVASCGNVAGQLEGRRDRVIVIGAHYDHLGFGGPASRAPFTRAIHNGADDNASGVAVMLELARSLAKERPPRAPTFVFVAFSGEEDGLAGSEAFLASGSIALSRILAYVNFEGVGRLDPTSRIVRIDGLVEHPAWSAMVERAKPAGIVLRTSDPIAPGGSDHSSFHARGVPTLSFSTGVTEDYHKPTDDADRLDYDGMRLVRDHALAILHALAQPAPRGARDSPRRVLRQGTPP